MACSQCISCIVGAGSSESPYIHGAQLLLHGPLMIVWAGTGVKSFYRASPYCVCKWEPGNDAGLRALTACLKEEFKKHIPENDAYSSLYKLGLITEKWIFSWESLAGAPHVPRIQSLSLYVCCMSAVMVQLCTLSTGIPEVHQCYSTEHGRMRALSSSMELNNTKLDDLTFNELLSLNNWRSDDLNKVFGVIDYAEEKERKDQQKRDDESARNKLKYAAATLTGVQFSYTPAAHSVECMHSQARILSRHASRCDSQ